MYCPHCGKELDEGVNFCPNCGAKTQQVSGSEPNEPNEEKDEFFDAPPASVSVHEQRTVEHEQTAPERTARVNVLAIVGFALSIAGYLLGGSSWILCIFTVLVSVAGLVCSSLGLVRCKRNGAKGKGFAIAGIVVGAVGIVVNLTMMIIFIVNPHFVEDLVNYILNFAGGNYY